MKIMYDLSVSMVLQKKKKKQKARCYAYEIALSKLSLQIFYYKKDDGKILFFT